jgi:hypothetical protein
MPSVKARWDGPAGLRIPDLAGNRTAPRNNEICEIDRRSVLASPLDLSDELPERLHLPHLEPGRVIAFLGIVMLVFLLVLGMEVLILGPDLRADGIHGVLAPTVLGLRARPVMLYDLEERQEPLGALYLGGNADLYVLYDPCTETIRFVPVGSSRVGQIDEVTCGSP